MLLIILTLFPIIGGLILPLLNKIQNILSNPYSIKSGMNKASNALFEYK